MQICCSARAGTPSAARYTPIPEAALAVPNIYPFRALIFIPQCLPNIFSPNILQPEPTSLGAQGISGPCLVPLPLPWLPQLEMQVGNDSSRGPSPSCHRAVTSEAVSPAGGLACRSWERFQLWHFKPPHCAGAHLSLPGVTWRN